ncbi:MAG: hypothetical protein HYZ53_02425 [Planctomycetes bacterium]|nr:hypothetical protein [Planctomycetota bacterium]
MQIEQTRWITGPLAAFDLGLGTVAVAAPSLYMQLLHSPEAPAPGFMLQRTGVLWLFFAAAEAGACLWPRRRPVLVFLVAALRWMDVPADLTYLLTTDPVTPFGRFSLLVSPLFNALAGGLLFHAWRRFSSASAHVS